MDIHLLQKQDLFLQKYLRANNRLGYKQRGLICKVQQLDHLQHITHQIKLIKFLIVFVHFHPSLM